MSGDPLDLDAIEADARHTGARPSVAQTLALVAEVRRLRDESVALVDEIERCDRAEMALRAVAAETEVRRLRAGRAIEQEALANALPIIVERDDLLTEVRRLRADRDGLHREWQIECDLRQDAQKIASERHAEVLRLRDVYVKCNARAARAEAEVERLRCEVDALQAEVGAYQE